MPRYRTVVRSTLPPERAFAYMSRFEHVPEWDPSAERSEPVPQGAEPAPGVEYRVRVRFRGKPQDIRYRIAEMQAPRRILLTGEGRRFGVRDEILVEPDGAGSRVVYDARILLSGLMRLTSPVVQRLFTRSGEAATEGMRRALNPAGGGEAGAP
ncbi:MAG TPA: SRPBCC family protein [Miltoncostaeaceae bacterium]|nr:SRPBCC family protein [Miltoncostaeaceae bacterium]